ncbi:MAG: DEAD/DEAH box helicase [Chryseolinea sp.]
MQSDLNLVHADILKRLAISELNTMQITFLEKAASARDMILLAPTGTGKTIAFLLDILSRLDPEEKTVQAIIIAPSRELAIQIDQVFRSLKTPFKVSCCYGGHSVKIEQDSLRTAPALLIGTPGRIADHLDRDSFDASKVGTVVLDEFDKSLEMGFHDQVRMIIGAMNGKQKHILTSATRLDVLPDFIKLSKPEVVNFLNPDSASKLTLKLVRASGSDRTQTLMRLVAGFNQEAALVFCNEREEVERISHILTEHKFEHGIFHGMLEQIDREKNLIKFRGGAHNLLIATDLAARGLDIPEIRHIVHFQLPPREQEFVHRNGRTARMHKDGQAYLIISDDKSLPPYARKEWEELVLPKALKLPPQPLFACIYISAGKKEGISKGDIAGLIIKKGGVSADDVGLITVLDHISFVAVKRTLATKLIDTIKEERLKKTKVKIALAN